MNGFTQKEYATRYTCIILQRLAEYHLLLLPPYDKHYF